MPSKSRQIRVLQLIEGLSFGGAETKLLELIAKMDRNRFHTTVCSLGMGDRIKGKFDELGVPFFNLARRGRIDPGLVWQVNRLIKQEKIDVVMTTLFYADVVGALAGAFSPAKAVLSWETISAPEWLRKHRLIAYRLAMKFCDRVVSVSEATARWLVTQRGLAESKITVIPYGVNLDEFICASNPSLRAKLGVSQETMLIGTVARLHPQKGHEYLITAAKSLVQSRYPNIKFVFVGDGELRQQLENSVRSAGLQERVMFLGFRDDVKELLKIFDIFVLPSLYEGLPNVVLEAMASGLPVVGTAVDGTPELIVDGETGFLVPPKDPRALAAKVAELLEDEAKMKTFGKRARARVEAYYSLDKQVDSFQNLYAGYVLNGVT